MKKTIGFFAFLGTVWGLFSIPVFASSYNQGIYNENVPYGSATYMSIATDGDVSLAITPTTAGVQDTDDSVITVISTDVVGYKLYIRSDPSTDMDNLGDTIPTSGNGSPAPLAVNTWGFNTDASNNFIGSSLSDILIRTGTGPYPSGDVTTVTFGLKVDLASPAGNYTTNVVYTAVPDVT